MAGTPTPITTDSKHILTYVNLSFGYLPHPRYMPDKTVLAVNALTKQVHGSFCK